MEVQEKSSSYIIAYKCLLNVPALFLGLLCGAWSDSVGRRPPVLFTCMGSAISLILFLASTYTREYFLPLILIGALIGGCFGKSTVTKMALESYISDTTDEGKRKKHMGRLVAMKYLGYFTGLMLSGALMHFEVFEWVFGTSMLCL